MTIDNSVIDKYKVDALIFSKNKTIESLDFEDIPVLVVEKDLFGGLYLSYLDSYINEYIEQRILIKITKARLQQVKKGSISIRTAFNSPESDDVYLVRFREDTGQVDCVFLIPSGVFSEINPISESYEIKITDSTEIAQEQREPEISFNKDIERLLSSVSENQKTLEAKIDKNNVKFLSILVEIIIKLQNSKDSQMIRSLDLDNTVKNSNYSNRNISGGNY